MPWNVQKRFAGWYTIFSRHPWAPRHENIWARVVPMNCRQVSGTAERSPALETTAPAELTKCECNVQLDWSSPVLVALSDTSVVSGVMKCGRRYVAITRRRETMTAKVAARAGRLRRIRTPAVSPRAAPKRA